mmetsp:Transcript_4197/g.13820  ORF Transcript_4197/g.13820 Transcript_4197/m.13820 type:complete len:84 (+) Transcript_4197:448-699(+)|eukprot:scaffold24529_cov140-Isochrysis_galbana.AAC.4
MARCFSSAWRVARMLIELAAENGDSGVTYFRNMFRRGILEDWIYDGFLPLFTLRIAPHRACDDADGLNAVDALLDPNLGARKG